MALHIEVTPDMETWIKAEVENGHFANASEVVGAALERMRAEGTRRDAFWKAVQVGIDQIERGEAVLLTPELWQQILDDVINDRDSGEPLNPDVLP